MENKGDKIYANYKNVLKGAKDGQVVTRFPPEPSGFLHIGHVKAAMLNYHYAKIYNGKMVLRFDDTNPLNEKLEFVENIQRDLKTLDIIPDQVSHTSDYFPQIVDYMKKLIKDGNAYGDNGTGEEMKDQRDNGIESPARARSVEENLKTFDAMLEGKAEGWCIRAKMNMQNKFKCLRDPVFYRCKVDVPHHRHGTKYKAYPTYDFACPIVDALEGITHAMRTVEYHDRNDGYHWVQKVLDLRSVQIYDYSRLNLVSTILSKRSLKWFVEEGIADGWEDPRFPTVQGIMRRGMTPEALKRFMLEQGPSKNTNLMEWDKIWAYNKEAIDARSARYTAIVKETACKLILSNGPETLKVETHPLHQKNADLGNKAVLYGKEIYIEQGDAKGINVGEKVTLMKWGNAVITLKEERPDGTIELHADLAVEDKDFKGTKKLTWIAIDEKTNFEITLVELDHLITKKKVEENEKVQDIVNKDSYISYTAIAEGNMRNVQKGDMIQLERRGYFYVDKLELQNQKMTIHFIPDGKSKNMSTIESKLDQKQVAGGKADKALDAAKDKKKAGGKDAAAPGEEVKLSKKDLNKLKKKEEKAAATAAAKSGAPLPPKARGGPPAGGAAKVAAAKEAGPLVYGTMSTDLTSTLNRYESTLQKSNYLNGNQLTSLDKDAVEFLKPHAAKLSPLTHPYTFAYFGLISKFSPKVMALWAVVEGKAAAPANKAAKKADDDMDDLFGSDDDDGAAAKAAAAAAKAKAQGGKKKKVVIAMSLVMLEVKPLDDTVDLDALAPKIFKEITQDGLFWKTEYKKVPVAFGIFKLIVGFSCEDAKTSVDDIVEKIEGMEDFVQSVDIQAFNKI